MTDILKLAKQVGMGGMLTDGVCTTDELQSFADLIRADYRAELLGVSVEPAADVYSAGTVETNIGTGGRAGYISAVYSVNRLEKGCKFYTAEALAAILRSQAKEIEGLKAKFAVNPSGYIRHEDVHGDEVGPPTPCYSEPPAPYGFQVKRAIAAEDERDTLRDEVARLNSEKDALHLELHTERASAIAWEAQAKEMWRSTAAIARLREALRVGLEALEDERYVSKYTHIVDAIAKMREALG